MTATIKLLTLMEAMTVTGPAKLLIEFSRHARSVCAGSAGLPRVEVTIVTFHRARIGDRPGLVSPAAAGLPAGEWTGGRRAPEGEGAPNEFVAAARAAGLEVEVIDERFRFDPGVLGQLRRIIERRAPDIIETNMIKSHFLVKLSGAGRRRPWVAFHHGYTTTDLRMRLYNRLNRLTLPAAARVVTVCGAFARQLARDGVRPERISVLHSSVEATPAPGAGEVWALRRRLGLAEGERAVLSVGRLSREKGHVDLVRAVGRLRRLNPALSFRLIVVGEGPERARAEAEARALGVSERVVFAGHAGDVRPYYALADVLALPSHSEGSPLVLLEAMAAGVPVVATAVGGVPEVAADGESALLVPPRDPQAFAAALDRLLSDAPLARSLAVNASAHVARHFSPEARARALVEIYGHLVAAGAHNSVPQSATA